MYLFPNNKPRTQQANLLSTGSNNAEHKSHIGQLLFETVSGFAWLANDVANVNRFFQIFKNSLRDCAIQNLQCKINESPKSIYNKHFKSLLDVEKYLLIFHTCIREPFEILDVQGIVLWLRRVDI